MFWQYQEFTDLQLFNSKSDAYFNNFLLNTITNLDTVFGYSLDMIGKLLKVDRRPVLLKVEGAAWNQFIWNQEDWNSSTTSVEAFEFMSDVNFRKLLKIRAKQLLLPRTMNSILETLDTVLPNMIFNYSETNNEIIINYDVSSVNLEEKTIITGGYLLSPQSCIITINEI